MLLKNLVNIPQKLSNLINNDERDYITTADTSIVPYLGIRFGLTGTILNLTVKKIIVNINKFSIQNNKNRIIS